MKKITNILKPKSKSDISKELETLTPAKRLMFIVKFILDKEIEDLFEYNNIKDIEKILYQKISENNSENVEFKIEKEPEMYRIHFYESTGLLTNEFKFLNPSESKMRYTLSIYNW